MEYQDDGPGWHCAFAYRRCLQARGYRLTCAIVCDGRNKLSVLSRHHPLPCSE